MGVSGQAKKLWVSVTGGWALLPAARRWAGEATVIGEVTAGWQTGVRAWAATTRDEKERRTRSRAIEAICERKNMGNPRVWFAQPGRDRISLRKRHQPTWPRNTRICGLLQGNGIRVVVQCGITPSSARCTPQPRGNTGPTFMQPAGRRRGLFSSPDQHLSIFGMRVSEYGPTLEKQIPGRWTHCRQAVIGLAVSGAVTGLSPWS